MKRPILILLLSIFSLSFLIAQENKWTQFEFIIGDWSGTGEGFSSGKSSINTSFEYLMNNQYIKVTNKSVFGPSENNPKGSTHEDWGIISYDKNRKKYIFRQFHIEGFVNQYVLSDSLSDDSTLIFNSETIENFVNGGTARFTIIKHKQNHIETVFDVAFPEGEYTCFGRNHLYIK
jgi:hypothetical protein